MACAPSHVSESYYSLCSSVRTLNMSLLNYVFAVRTSMVISIVQQSSKGLKRQRQIVRRTMVYFGNKIFQPRGVPLPNLISLTLLRHQISKTIYPIRLISIAKYHDKQQNDSFVMGCRENGLRIRSRRALSLSSPKEEEAKSSQVDFRDKTRWTAVGGLQHNEKLNSYCANDPEILRLLF